MKSYLRLITVAMLLVSGDAYSQGFRFGALAGLDFPKVRVHETGGGNLDMYDRTTGFNINLYVAYKTKSFIGLSIEPGYMLKGTNMENSYTDFLDSSQINETIRLKLDYIQIPVLLDFYVLKERLIFQIGPEFAFKTGAKLEDTDIRSIYNQDFELSGIAGVNLHLLKFFDIGLRYNFGLSTITDPIPMTDINGTVEGEVKEYNNYIQLLLRFKLGAKKG